METFLDEAKEKRILALLNYVLSSPPIPYSVGEVCKCLEEMMGKVRELEMELAKVRAEMNSLCAEAHCHQLDKAMYREILKALVEYPGLPEELRQRIGRSLGLS
ncbi:MAG: hypothetical protein KGL39_26950 [Patescibacteria group bacterium]|nr:hypothetical protein [Patescibacteria group bacterium]